jgi:hypothetical protein
MSRASMEEAERILGELGVAGVGGWSVRVRPQTLAVHGRWPAVAQRRDEAQRAAWQRFLLLVGRRKGALRQPWTWLFG